MKKQFLKRCMAMILAVMMMVNVMPVNVFATTGTDDHIHTEECIDSHDEISETPEEPVDLQDETSEVLEEQDEVTEDLSEGTEQNYEVVQLKEEMEGILVKYLGATDMSKEEVEAKIFLFDSNITYNAWTEASAFEAKVVNSGMTEEDLIIYFSDASTETFSAFYSTMETIMNPMAIANVIDIIEGKVTIEDSQGNGNYASNKYTANVSYSWFGNTNTLTVKNVSSKKGKLSFTYTTGAIGSNDYVTVDGTTHTSTVTNINYSVDLDAEKSITIILYNRGVSGSTSITITNFNFVEAAEKSNVIINFDTTSGNVTAGDSVVANGATYEVDSENGMALVATANSDTKFYGWVDNTGAVISKEASFTYKPVEDSTIKAMFVKDGGKNVYGVTTASSASTGGFLSSYTYYDVSETYQYVFDDLGAALACA